MTFVAHLCVIAVYLSAGFAAAQLGPLYLGAIEGAVAGVSLVYGALALAVLAVLHATFTGYRWRTRARRDIAALQQSFDDVQRELGTARTEVQQIFDAIQTSRSNVRDEAYQNVVKEVKVLQDLIERLQEAHSPTPETIHSAPEAGAMDDEEVLDVVRDALQANRVDLYLQPIVALPQRRTQYYECLSRIRDGEGQVIMPERYLPVAERFGLSGAIDNLLLFRCVQLVRKARRKRDGVAFFTHVSAQSLGDHRFFNDFLGFMADNAELAGNLYFEFSQSELESMSPDMARHLNELADIGFRFSLDRVGRLDMNFYELSRRGFRIIKMDAPTLLENLEEMETVGRADEFWETLTRAHIDIIPEKVEDETTLVELLDYPIHHAQGYLFGEPRLARE